MFDYQNHLNIYTNESIVREQNDSGVGHAGNERFGLFPDRVLILLEDRQFIEFHIAEAVHRKDGRHRNVDLLLEDAFLFFGNDGLPPELLLVPDLFEFLA